MVTWDSAFSWNEFPEETVPSLFSCHWVALPGTPRNAKILLIKNIISYADSRELGSVA